MGKRVKWVLKMRVRLITVRNRVDFLLFVFVAAYLLCCGDVELNPGPMQNEQHAPEESTKVHDSGMTAATGAADTSKTSGGPPSESAAGTGIPTDVAAEILETLRTQAERFKSMETDMSSMRIDLGDIKSDIGQVRKKCEEIGRRCDSLEEDTQKLTSSLTETKDDVTTLFNVCNTNEDTFRKMFSKFEEANSEIETLKENCEKLESFSRRDNLRMYGVPQREKFESFDTCARLVADTLNSVEGPKRWTTDDIARAHRVGESRNGRPKPMIVKFNHWKDKMAVITDREYRDGLKEKGVAVANDLTRKQASMVAEARKEGKVAFFKRGKLTWSPDDPTPGRMLR
jgi:archaellum component FlaC